MAFIEVNMNNAKNRILFLVKGNPRYDKMRSMM